MNRFINLHPQGENQISTFHLKLKTLPLIKSISGIRGTIGGKSGENLTPIDIVECAAAYGTFIKETTGKNKIVIGRDARISVSYTHLTLPTKRIV